MSAPLVDLHNAFASVVDDPHRPSILTVPQAPPESTPCLDTFEPVSFWNVECILNSLNTGKAAGSDGIPPSFLTCNWMNTRDNVSTLCGFSLSMADCT